MSWENKPQVLKERYEKISSLNVGPLKVAILEDMNKLPIPVSPGSDTLSYEIFANEFNAIMLTAHIFENLIYFEDKRLELEGYDDFQIKIPERYFRHPSLNLNNSSLEKNDKNLSEIVNKTKTRLNYVKDQSFVLSQLHKLEFISVFSHLEAYIESLLVEVLNIERKKAVSRVRREPLPKLMVEVFNEIDVKIVETIRFFDSEALDFISFCHKLRNLHTHNLGIVTEYFYNDCIKSGFLCHDSYSETSEPVLDFARLNFSYVSKIFVIGKTVNLTTVSQPFRLLAREIVFISEAFCKEKLRK